MTEQKASPILAWWAQRPPRQRLILAGAAVVAVVVGGDRFLTGPMERQVAATQTQVKTLEKRWAEQSQAAKKAAAATTPEETLRQREAELRARLETAQKRLETINRSVADQSRLPETVRTLIATVGSARLVALDLRGEVEDDRATPGPQGEGGSNTSTGADAAAKAAKGAKAAKASAADKGASNDPAQDGPASKKLYRLPITVKVSGSYSELQAVLSLFERHAESLQWTALSLDSSEWPAIQMTLRAYVLSFEPRWGASP